MIYYNSILSTLDYFYDNNYEWKAVRKHLSPQTNKTQTDTLQNNTQNQKVTTERQKLKLRPFFLYNEVIDTSELHMCFVIKL